MERNANLFGARVLVTGAAGFIGFHLTKRLLAEGCCVTGFDNLNDYYDPGLKRARLARLQEAAGFRFVQADLADAAALGEAFSQAAPEVVVNLAAQAGVRYSIECPQSYVSSNLVGFFNFIELEA